MAGGPAGRRCLRKTNDFRRITATRRERVPRIYQLRGNRDAFKYVSIRFCDRRRSFRVETGIPIGPGAGKGIAIITNLGRMKFEKWNAGKRARTCIIIFFPLVEKSINNYDSHAIFLRDRHDRCVVKHNGAYSTRRCSPTEHGSRVPSRMCARALLFLFWRTLVSHSTRNPISSPLSRLSRLTACASFGRFNPFEYTHECTFIFERRTLGWFTMK